MSTWGWIALGFGLFCCGCFALLWVAILGGKQHDQAIDAMVDLVSEPSEMEWQEFELRAHSDYDVYRFAQRMPGEERP